MAMSQGSSKATRPFHEGTLTPAHERGSAAWPPLPACPHCQIIVLAEPQDPRQAKCPRCGRDLNALPELGVDSTQDHVRLLGRFQLLHCVGRGSYGEVWKARDP